MKRRHFMGSAIAAGFAFSSQSLFAQKAYPNKQIRFVVPFAAGAGPKVKRTNQ
jgi:tripartite-type tricarboxylate transporter receptor subunit TctC